MSRNPYMAGSRLAVENSPVSFRRFRSSARPCFYWDFSMAEREGWTRAFGPRPAGDACASSKIALGDFVEPPGPYLRFESPRCRCHSKLNENIENLPTVWRRGRDYSALRASPLRGRPSGVIPASSPPQLSERERREFTYRLAEREGFEPSMGF